MSGMCLNMFAALGSGQTESYPCQDTLKGKETVLLWVKVVSARKFIYRCGQ